MQNKHPTYLPTILKDWEFLPVWFRSLRPYDEIIVKYLLCFKCCKSLAIGSEFEEKSPDHSQTDESRPNNASSVKFNTTQVHYNKTFEDIEKF